MKGLELSRAYFEAYGDSLFIGLPSEVRYRAAVGLAGPGSECLGFDDELSHDHDFGPGFCVWLPRDLYRAWGAELQRRYDLLPRTFAGFTRRETELAGQRVGVFETEAFFRTFTGLDHVPNTPKEWIVIPEQFLATATSGEVFSDPSGTMVALRSYYLRFYPEPVIRQKVAANFASMAQSGQYNLPRSQRRGDAFAADAARTEFLASFVAVIHLLRRVYAPFYKWSLRSLSERANAPAVVVDAVKRIAAAPVSDVRERDIEACCSLVLATVRALGWMDAESDFLLDAALAIHRGIEDGYLASCPLGTGAFR